MIRAMAILFFTILAAAPARADIELSPLRQVLTNKTRVASFTLSNPSTRIIDGRVTWIDLSATPTGYAPADAQTRAKLSAAPYLTLTPAQFRLEPGARIEVTVRLKNGVRPPPGERRSHLLVETSAARTLIRKASSGLQADIAVGVSVPVLLRGRGRGSAVLSETKLLRDSRGMLLISVAIAPTGAYSTFGRLTATFLSAEPDAKPELLGVRDNVAGYPDAPHRRIEIPLGFFSLGEGELTLRYEGGGEYAGRIFDERNFTITPPK